jgi:hypothetical protein
MHSMVEGAARREAPHVCNQLGDAAFFQSDTLYCMSPSTMLRVPFHRPTGGPPPPLIAGEDEGLSARSRKERSAIRVFGSSAGDPAFRFAACGLWTDFAPSLAIAGPRSPALILRSPRRGRLEG